MPTPLRQAPQLPVKLGTESFMREGASHFRWMHEHAPVCRAKVSVMKVALVAGYEDCRAMLKDPRIVRDRRKAGGKSKAPIPLPRSIRMMASSMINEDEPEHRRQRQLVAQAFTPRALERLAGSVEELTDQLLEELPRNEPFDLIETYSLPIPVTVIRNLLGVNEDEMPRFTQGLRSLTRGYSFFLVMATLFIDMPRTVKLLDAMIERKRAAPAEDMLSALIAAEEAGEQLSHEELLAMSYLLIVAGYETTVHLITNAVLTLLQHPDQLAELRAGLGTEAGEELLEAAIEEVLRYAGPVQGTKPGFPVEDIVIRDVELPRGTMLFPCLAAANRDPSVWEDPDRFDIHRPRHKHMGFGFGPHFCVGAALARLETKIALRKLLQRFEHIELAVPDSELEITPMPLWFRYKALPLRVR